MDVKIVTKEINFTYRTAALIILGSRILVQRNNSYDYISLPGGKCQIGETSSEAIVREIKEETGLDTECIKTRTIIENLFFSQFDNKKRHELLFINELKLLSEVDVNKIMHNLEDNYDGGQYFEWIEISDLQKYNIKPDFILDTINNDTLVHKVRIEGE